ncbi:hypothetical protein [Actinoplanes sp. TBRC 11911]|uniref:hypothetical protein n=1 Tax=Actinoplanes sp. TBRC 11911 TaxID=2729386 RepID=UPI001B7D6CA2|nr:hypothetical protein [Actinoplanes sp. TBRC 11911]
MEIPTVDPGEGLLLAARGVNRRAVATTLTFNQPGRPIELTTQVYRGDRYRFRASITNGQ